MGKNNRLTIEVYKGIVIRKTNIVRLGFSASKYKELIDEVEKTGLSLPKLISISGRPCEKCRGIDVVIFNDDSAKISVKRGIISDYTMMNNGVNIMSKCKK